MMTRKDYVSTAEILNNFNSKIDLETLKDLTDEFISMFESDNEKFNSDKFWEKVFPE